MLEGAGRKAKGIYVLKILFWPLGGEWIVDCKSTPVQRRCRPLSVLQKETDSG